MTANVRYVSPLLWQGTPAQANIRQAVPVVWSQQKVMAYVRSLQAIQWMPTPTPVYLRDVTGLQWTQDQTIVTARKVTALQWTQDYSAVSARSLKAVQWAKLPTQGQMRQVSAFSLQQSSTSGSLRQVSAFTLQKSAKPALTGGLAGLWPLIQADASITVNSSNLSVSAPVADSTQPNCNTYVTVAPIGALLNSYSGTYKLYYNRQDINIAFAGNNNTWKLSVPSATTVKALLSSINSAYGIALDPTDVVDGPVAAGATQLQITIASTSYVYLPGSTLWLMNSTPITTAITNTNLPGFASARGNLVDPPLSSIITNVDLPGFASATGAMVGDYKSTIKASAPYAYYRLNETSGQIAADSSGNGYNGSYVGSMSLAQTSLVAANKSKYPTFPGTIGSYVDISAARNFCAGTQWTFEAWVNVTAGTQNAATSVSQSTSLISDTGDTGTSTPGTGFDLSMLFNWTTANCFFYWPADNKQFNTAANTTPALGTTAHLAITYNAGLMNFYVNGTLVSSQTTSTPPTIRSFLKLGAQSWTGGQLNGSMAEVALYTTALTQSQLHEHYAVGLGSVTIGQQAFMNPGTYSFVVPAGVYLLSGVGIGSGGGSWGHTATNIWGRVGAGAGLGWKAAIPVTPGETLTVTVAAPGATSTSTSGGMAGSGATTQLARGSTVLFAGYGGQPGGNTQTSQVQAVGGLYAGDGGGQGGLGTLTYWQLAGGGGGAGGYSGPGGAGGGYTTTGPAGSGGSGGGGSGAANSGGIAMTGGAGGGTGLYGLGASAGLGGAPNVQMDGLPGSYKPGSGMFGGGGAMGQNTSSASDPAQGGGLRLIWGPGRIFPSNQTLDCNHDPVQGGPADILAHFEGTTTVGYGFDQCGNQSCAIYNNAAFTTAAAAFGTQSVSLTSGVDCIFFNARGQTDFQATGDFTFDVYLSKKSGATLSAVQSIMCDRQPGSAPYGVPQGVAGNTMASMHFWIATSGHLMANIFGVTNVDTGYNLWNDIPGSGKFAHIALMVRGLTLYVFVNGVMKASYTGAARNGATWTPQINVGNSPTLVSPMNTCYIDEVRFVNGLARYPVAGFTPATKAFQIG
jgi:hypothetical protein